MVPFNRAVYGMSPPGTFYYTEIDCTGAVYVGNCSGNETFAAQCLNGTLEYTLQCYNIKGTGINSMPRSFYSILTIVFLPNSHNACIDSIIFTRT